MVDEDTKVRRARRPDAILVEVIGGPMDGMSRRSAGESLSIGRTEENDLAIPFDLSVSGKHARVVIDAGQYWLEDLGSTNGTFLGEGRIQGRVLIALGTVFVVGRTTLELMAS
ncbi:MAG TPA: FHA domain-containing protein [Candidatus Polarisedimenticolia bacterium]|nr:FHA domain-containing protein [Candidatus Polarisedimenticolia bacterium]